MKRARVLDRKSVCVALLTVLLPSLAVTFWLSRGGTMISETATLDPVVWTFRRSSQFADLLEKLDATCVSDELFGDMYVLILHYSDNSKFSDDYDYLRMLVVVNATSNDLHSYIKSVAIVAQTDRESMVDWMRTGLHLENLALTALVESHRWRPQAYIKLAGLNDTNSVYAQATAEWSLLTPNTQRHQMEIGLEIVYYNGTTFNKVTQPFQLNIESA
jgi:hypothetical protein